MFSLRSKSGLRKAYSTSQIQTDAKGISSCIQRSYWPLCPKYTNFRLFKRSALFFWSTIFLVVLVIAVGYSSGDIVLCDIEDSTVLHTSKLSATLSSMVWIDRGATQQPQPTGDPPGAGMNRVQDLLSCKCFTTLLLWIFESPKPYTL